VRRASQRVKCGVPGTRDSEADECNRWNATTSATRLAKPLSFWLEVGGAILVLAGARVESHLIHCSACCIGVRFVWRSKPTPVTAGSPW
jgi:hypothetical protein